ncbi:RDD family protein [Candidatus Poriferisocius sp.]|uniref:RDD family protein n=1 Tax=Candidatus Poriferisocius sp. TaxID=3101276 RepID=UPI003B5B0A9B
MSVSSWEPDPTSRHQYRWWDGEQWTDQVADDGVQSVDPVSAAEADLPHGALPSLPPPSMPESDMSEGQFRSETPDPLSMLSSRGKRLGGIFLEFLLLTVTLGIGWLLWSLYVYSRGQTPAKQLLKMRVVRVDQGEAADIWWMVLRELVLKMIPSLFLLGLLWVAVSGLSILTNDRLQALWDKMLKTVVIDDPGDLYKPHPYSRDRLWQQ